MYMHTVAKQALLNLSYLYGYVIFTSVLKNIFKINKSLSPHETMHHETVVMMLWFACSKHVWVTTRARRISFFLDIFFFPFFFESVTQELFRRIVVLLHVSFFIYICKKRLCMRDKLVKKIYFTIIAHLLILISSIIPEYCTSSFE